MLTIRLARTGKKKQAYFRIIVSEKAWDTKGKYLESLGTLNPHTDPPAVTLDTDRIKYWIAHGASTSPHVHNLLVEHKVLSEDKVRIWKPKKKPIEEVKAPAATEAPPADEAAPTPKAETAPATEAKAKAPAAPVDAATETKPETETKAETPATPAATA